DRGRPHTTIDWHPAGCQYIVACVPEVRRAAMASLDEDLAQKFQLFGGDLNVSLLVRYREGEQYD
ncbi:MAG: hypothetical protein ACKPKO_10910, partial [Candidatus Fonsibacter sp.]